MQVYAIMLYMRLPETYFIKGYDSARIKPDLGDYSLIPEINGWVYGKKADRFDIVNVQSAIRKISLEFDEKRIAAGEDVVEANKHGLCGATYMNLLTYGRKAAIYPVLEGLRMHALADVFKKEESRSELVRSRYAKQTIDELVVRQVIQYYFDDIQKAANGASDTKNGKKGSSFSLN